jgi:hypothetical protein
VSLAYLIASEAKNVRGLMIKSISSKIARSKVSTAALFLSAFLLSDNACLAEGPNQYETGTFYRVVHDQKYIVGAIDSRLTGGADTGTSDTCKLIALGDHAFFLAEGVVKQTGVDGQGPFDAYAVAKQSYLSSAASDVATKTAAEKFVTVANDAFAKNYQGGPDRIYVVGIFAESLPDGSLNLDFASVYSKKGALGRVVAGAAPPDGAEAASYQPPGFSEITKEANERTTERSKTLYDRLSERLSRSTSADQGALAADDAVQAVEDWSNNKSIGGDVATVILEAGKPLRWYTKPSSCD